MININDFFLILTNMDKNSKFLLTMIAIIIIILVIIIILSAISKKKEDERLKMKKQVPTDKELIKEKLKKLDFQFEEAEKEEKIQKEDIKKEVPVMKKMIEPEEEIEVIEVEENNDIETIASMIENRSPKEFNLNEFEQEQEECAIISYDELVKKAGAKKIVYKTKKVEQPKSFEQMSMNFEPIKEVKKSSTPFRPSQVVSPIYGVQKSEEKKEVKEIKQTRLEKYDNIKTGDKEMDEDIEFLNKLKKFRRGLN